MTESATRIREFKMPDVGEGLTEAEILKWYVQAGDTVTDGQVVCEVETAKAAVELPIPFNGAVHELRFAEGTTVDVGTAIIAVDTDPSAPGRSAEPPAGTAASCRHPRRPPRRRPSPRAASPCWSATASPSRRRSAARASSRPAAGTAAAASRRPPPCRAR